MARFVASPRFRDLGSLAAAAQMWRNDVLRSISIAAALLVAMTQFAWAASDFSHASCDSPTFQSYMLARLGHGKSLGTGKAMTDRFNFGPITRATTVSNTGKVISCEISVNVATARGSHAIHGRFTATLGVGPRGSWRWQPGY
jgi:hypothetical protein